MNSLNSGDILFSFVSIFGLLFYIVPIIFIIWFTISTTKQLKMQTKLLEEIKKNLNR